jgi:hypothetical protein
MREASRALARLDADRLEELAISCRALNRGGGTLDPEKRMVLARQARDAAGDMAVFARVLEATRTNLRVITRLREMRLGRLEYRELPAVAQYTLAETEGRNGND